MKNTEFKEISNFITNTKKEICDVSENVYDKHFHNYIIKDFELPILFPNRFNYEDLTNIHFKTYMKIEQVKNHLLYYNTFEKKSISILRKLYLLKEVTENLIQNQPEYTLISFSRNFVKLKNDFFLKGNFIELEDNIKSQKIRFLKLLYNKLVKKERISKDAKQRKLFISLFSEDKMIKDYIIWNNRLWDLKLFIDLMIEKKLFKPNEFINVFASNNFKTINLQGEIQKFKSDSFKTARSKESYQKDYYKWEKEILELTLKL